MMKLGRMRKRRSMRRRMLRKRKQMRKRRKIEKPKEMQKGVKALAPNYYGVVREACDLLYHMLVLLAKKNEFVCKAE
jgi:phosphoribosyl-ATP pyrophosphohydrolase